ANIYAGGQGSQGDIALSNESGQQTIHLDGGGGNLNIGGGGAQGDIGLRDEVGKQTIHLDGGDANINMGGEGHNADIRMMNANGDITIHFDAGAGDILLDGRSLAPADFVFAANYSLPSLGDVRSFIHRHGHLPHLPAGQEMKAAGVSLGEFTMTLLRKVEELTLYLIKQDDVIQQQQQRLDQVEERMRS
ncbi:MAG: hypothetical protein ACRDTA_30070, partial [Pseudonocardiaceae bacterium]